MTFGALAISNLAERHAQVVATAVQYIQELHQHWTILHMIKGLMYLHCKAVCVSVRQIE